jgi:hypothetical protein
LLYLHAEAASKKKRIEKKINNEQQQQFIGQPFFLPFFF